MHMQNMQQNLNTTPATIPLVSIEAKMIILPGDHLTVKTDLPDQNIVVEAIKSSRWPQPQLAVIKNNMV